MRVVLDTNVLISGYVFGGLPRALIRGAFSGAFQLVISPALLSELEGVLAERFEMDASAVRTLRSDIEQVADVVIPSEVPRVLDDPDDDEVLAVAVSGEADLIVSGDKDLLRLGSYRDTPIVAPREAVGRIEGVPKTDD